MDYVLYDAKNKKYITEIGWTYPDYKPWYTAHPNICHAKTYSPYMKNKTSLSQINKTHNLECFWHKLTKQEFKQIQIQQCKDTIRKNENLLHLLTNY